MYPVSTASLTTLPSELYPLILCPPGGKNATYKQAEKYLCSAVELKKTSKFFQNLVGIDFMIKNMGYRLLFLNAPLKPDPNGKDLLSRQSLRLISWRKNQPVQTFSKFRGSNIGYVFHKNEEIEQIECNVRQVRDIYRRTAKGYHLQELIIPPDKLLPYEKNTNSGFAAASGEKYLAVKPCQNQGIYLFYAEDNRFVKKLSLKDALKVNLKFYENVLFVHIKDRDMKEKLILFDAESSMGINKEFSIPEFIASKPSPPGDRLSHKNPHPFCFGMKQIVKMIRSEGMYRFYVGSLDSLCASNSLSSSAEQDDPFYVTEEMDFSSTPQIFPDGDQFVAVTKKNGEFKIERISFQKGKDQKEILAEGITFNDNFTNTHVFYKWGRLFAAYADWKQPFAFYSYDVEKKEISNFLPSEGVLYSKRTGPGFCDLKENGLINFVTPALSSSNQCSQLSMQISSFDYRKKNTETKSLPTSQAIILKG